MLARYDREKVIAAASGAVEAMIRLYEEGGLVGNEKELARRKLGVATDISMGALYAEGPTVTLHMEEFKLLHMHWPHGEGALDGEG